MRSSRPTGLKGEAGGMFGPVLAGWANGLAWGTRWPAMAATHPLQLWPGRPPCPPSLLLLNRRAAAPALPPPPPPLQPAQEALRRPHLHRCHQQVWGE